MLVDQRSKRCLTRSSQIICSQHLISTGVDLQRWHTLEAGQGLAKAGITAVLGRKPSAIMRILFVYHALTTQGQLLLLAPKYATQ